MIQIVRIDPHSDLRYLSFLENHADATIFHHPSWMRVLERVYGYVNETMACVEGDTLLGVLPILEVRSFLTGRRGVSLPFVDSCPPLLSDPSASLALAPVLRNKIQKNKWKSVEIRGPFMGEDVYDGSPYKSHIIRLPENEQAAFRTFHVTRTQQPIKKFYKYGGRVERRTDPDALRTFIELNYLTRKKHGIPPQPDDFFYAIQEELISRQLGYVSIAIVNEQRIAASIFLTYKSGIIYKFAASLNSGLRYHPNHAIIWDAIQHSILTGRTTFDLGRSDISNSGLITFKRSWGADEKDLRYRIIAKTPPRSPIAIPALSRGLALITTRMPVRMLRTIGKILYRHIG